MIKPENKMIIIVDENTPMDDPDDFDIPSEKTDFDLKQSITQQKNFKSMGTSQKTSSQKHLLPNQAKKSRNPKIEKP